MITWYAYTAVGQWSLAMLSPKAEGKGAAHTPHHTVTSSHLHLTTAPPQIASVTTRYAQLKGKNRLAHMADHQFAQLHPA